MKQGRRRRRRRRRAARQPRGDVEHRSGRRGPLRTDRRAGVRPAGRQLARRSRDRSAAGRSHDPGARPAARLVPLRSRHSLPAHADSHAPRASPFPVSEVATMERANGQGELRRENLRPMAVVSGRLEGRDLGSAVADIQTQARRRSSCRSATPTRSAGSTRRRAQAFRELLMVFALAVVPRVH